MHHINIKHYNNDISLYINSCFRQIIIATTKLDKITFYL